MGGAGHFKGLAESIRTRFGKVFDRLELRPAGLLGAAKPVQQALANGLLKEFDALSVEGRKGVSKLAAYVEKHRNALHRVASGSATVEEISPLHVDNVEGWDLPSDMLFIERVFNHVTAIGKNAAHSSMHNASCKVLRKVNKTVVTANDIRNHTPAWKVSIAIPNPPISPSPHALPASMCAEPQPSHSACSDVC